MVRQPFVVGSSQVGATDGLGQTNEADQTGIASTLAFGTPSNRTATTISGIASTLGFGTSGGSRAIGSFTIGTSQVGGTDVLGAADLASRNLTGIASTV